MTRIHYLPPTFVRGGAVLLAPTAIPVETLLEAWEAKRTDAYQRLDAGGIVPTGSHAVIVDTSWKARDYGGSRMVVDLPAGSIVHRTAIGNDRSLSTYAVLRPSA